MDPDDQTASLMTPAKLAALPPEGLNKPAFAAPSWVRISMSCLAKVSLRF